MWQFLPMFSKFGKQRLKFIMAANHSFLFEFRADDRHSVIPQHCSAGLFLSAGIGPHFPLTIPPKDMDMIEREFPLGVEPFDHDARVDGRAGPDVNACVFKTLRTCRAVFWQETMLKTLLLRCQTAFQMLLLSCCPCRVKNGSLETMVQEAAMFWNRLLEFLRIRTAGCR